ncbi:hypothetical protein HY933_04295 [Candidatus Falkowbacteria bacterium]|nr:hypothetical protein [Candidatus Falkowbacteria bacterium]
MFGLFSKKYFLAYFILISFSIFLVAPVLAANTNDFKYQQLGNPLAKPVENSQTYENKSVVGEDLSGLTGRLAQAVIGLVGAAVFIMVVYGGLLWLFASGNEEKVATAKKTLVWAVIGLLVVFAAYAIVSFTLQQAQDAVIGQPAAE